MKQWVGRSLNRYQLTELLGEGGMGAVFKAQDLTLQRDVAIKVMHPHAAGRPGFRQRFLREARVAARLDHPGIVPVYDFGQADEMLYIVMKFIPGANMRAMLQSLKEKGHWIPLDEAIQLMRQLCQAMDYVHHQGVLHRDLKPSNVMIEPESSETLPYRPILTDLGLARLLADEGLTRAGTSMGTPTYMSPEQAEGRPVDARSDVYALGVMLYELATGRPPFVVRSLTEAIRCHTKEPPPDPRTFRPDLPTGLRSTILRALEKDPARRQADAAALDRDMASQLDDATQMETTAAGTAAGVSLLTEYQRSLSVPRGPSVLKEFATPPGNTGDQIQARLPDGSTRTMPLSGTLTLGRGEDNDLTLADNNVSRHHAQVAFDGQAYQVTDLNSTNGTYIGGAKLLPGVPEPWAPDQPLRVGGTWLRLHRTMEHIPTSPLASRASAASMTADRSVGITLNTTQVQVEPGRSTTLNVTLFNQSPLVGHFQVHTSGVPKTWVDPTSRTQLMPGDQRTIPVMIHPPRNPESRAGRYQLSLWVADQEGKTQGEVVQAAVVVPPYQAFDAELRPQRIRARRSANLVIHNRGNASEAFNVLWQDREDAILFSPPRSQTTIAPGASGRIPFQAKARKRPLIGGQKSYDFTAEVSTRSSDTRRLTGEILSRGLIPPWVLPVLGIALIAILAVAGMLFSQMQATQRTHVAQQTATAATATEVYLASLSDSQATMTAATATAIWLQDDSDRDGLTNQEETELGTLPDKRDTDEDGISDGDEVAMGLLPLDEDTDDDGLKDGMEMSQGIDPSKPDTDGDGLNDAEDPAPGQMPTPTHTPTPEPITPTPGPTTLTPTSTPVPVATPNGGGGGLLAFEAVPVGGGDGDQRIYTIDVNGHHMLKITPERQGSGDGGPSWSPNGQSIIYWAWKDGSPNLYRMSADGGGLEQLTDWEGQELYPRWSPDGRYIAFTADRDGNSELYLMDTSSKDSKALTNNAEALFEIWPSWSPDSKQIAFTMARDSFDSVDLYTIDVDGSNMTQITYSGTAMMPSWSPEGNQLVFVERTGEDESVVAVTPAGGSGRPPTRLGLGTGSQVISPQWSPDGTQIAFAARNEDTWGLYVMNADGSNVRALALNLGGIGSVSWQPPTP